MIQRDYVQMKLTRTSQDEKEHKMTNYITAAAFGVFEMPSYNRVQEIYSNVEGAVIDYISPPVYKDSSGPGVFDADVDLDLDWSDLEHMEDTAVDDQALDLAKQNDIVSPVTGPKNPLTLVSKKPRPQVRSGTEEIRPMRVLFAAFLFLMINAAIVVIAVKCKRNIKNLGIFLVKSRSKQPESEMTSPEPVTSESGQKQPESVISEFESTASVISPSVNVQTHSESLQAKRVTSDPEPLVKPSVTQSSESDTESDTPESGQTY
eukprot:43097_1